jgi:CBS domain-containing protein
VTAARWGRRFAFLLVALGMLELVGGGFVGAVWLMFLGWFLLSAASAEANGSVMGSRLAGVAVREVMTPDLIAVPAHTTVEQLVERWLSRHRCSTFPIVDDGRVVGLVTLARVKRIAATERASTWVTDVATPVDDVVRCQVDDGLVEVVGRMNASPDQRALVYDGDRLVGIVSPSDVTRTVERAELAGAATR